VDWDFGKTILKPGQGVKTPFVLLVSTTAVRSKKKGEGSWEKKRARGVDVKEAAEH